MRRKIVFIPLAILGGLAFVAAGGEIVRLLWNWLAPDLFGWKEISYWQALGLLALTRILFGGLGCGSRGGSEPRRRNRERAERMTPEERERLREGLRGGSGGEPETD